jgi:poly(hydroxyalkanoate) granule-associated protein
MPKLRAAKGLECFIGGPGRGAALTPLEFTMVKKTERASKADTQSGAQFSDTVKQSAQQIWLAGLGAFSKAQEQGGKAFDTLVKEGVAIQRKTQSAAEEKVSEAATRMASMAGDISNKASGHWGKLETIFEERVAKALQQLGVPSAKDVDVLLARIEELDRKVSKLDAKSGASTRTAGSREGRPTASTRKPASKAAKRAPARKSP